MSLTKLRMRMQAETLDAFVVNTPKNRRYISEFTGSAGLLLITLSDQFIISDSRYYEQIGRQAPDWTLVEAGYDSLKYLQQTMLNLGLDQGAKVGFEAESLSVAQFESWRKALPKVDWVATENLILNLRAVKTETELDHIRRAVALSDSAMVHLYQWLKPGTTEKDAAWEMERFMRTQGAEALAFDIIVASGPNAALPHARPSKRIIQEGDPVVVDMGCVIQGYASDLTRTFCLGTPKHEDYPKVWHIVDQANNVAKEHIKAGMSGKEADALARDVIKAAGYGDYFGHSLGHGVGLDIHENPSLSYARDSQLEAGAVITIEPGIYLPNAFGVRLEDMAVVRDDGVEVLTGVPKVDILR